MTVWNFRIDRHDASGNRLAPVPVEMRGYSFSGSVSNGDEIRVKGRWKSGTLHVEELDNLTTGAEVRAKSYRTLRTVLLIVFLLIFACVAVLMISFISNMPKL